MTWLAAAVTGLCVYLAVGAATGRLPTLRRAGGSPTDRGEWLRRAGVELDLGQFVTLSIAIGATTGGLVLASTGTPAVAIVPAIAAGLTPRALVLRRAGARARELQEAWPDALRDLRASTSAGFSLHQGLIAMSSRGPAPIRDAFTRYPVLARVAGVVAALEVIREELADPTSDRVIEVLILAHERGGHILHDILSDLAEDTARDVRVLEDIETDALEQRINAAAVFVLPWVVLLVLTAREGHFRDFYRSGGGLLVVTFGAVLSVLGLWLVTRLARRSTEPRVFGAESDG